MRKAEFAVVAVFAVVISLFMWVGPVAATGSATVLPPSSIAGNCTQDVSTVMQRWLNALPAGTTVAVPAGSCYLVNEGLALMGAHGLTITGGTWRDASTPVTNASPKSMNPVFWLVGGSGITLQGLTIAGSNAGGYNPAGAFAAGIRVDGVVGLTVSNVTISGVYGDGIELTALRADGDIGSTIINPTESASVSNVAVTGAGRQGITLDDVSGAVLSSLVLNHIGINAFDVEADQWNEGAQNVTINGCTVGGPIGGLFFANGGAGAGGWTGNLTVENCKMSGPAAGEAVLVQDSPGQDTPRGPFTFVNDMLECGSSVYVACVEDTNGRIAIDSSTLQMPAGTIHERVYAAVQGSTVNFGSDTVAGYGSVGTADASSSVSIGGGSWTPYGWSSGGTTPGGIPTTTTTTTTTVPRPGEPAPSITWHAAGTTSSSSPPTLTTSQPQGRLTSDGAQPHLTANESAPPYSDVAARTPWLGRVLEMELMAGCALSVALVLGRKRRQRRPVPARTTMDLLRNPDPTGRRGS